MRAAAASPLLQHLTAAACSKRPRPEWHGSTTTVRSVEIVSTSVTDSFAVPLSIVDAHLRQEQLPFAYFFKEALSKKKLLSSLKKVLERFPVLGGSVDFSKTMSIQCSPEDSIAVSFADSDRPIAHWIQRGHLMHTNRHPTLLPLFDPLFVPRHKVLFPTYPSLASIQVTSLADGGTVIGVNMNHMLADAASCFYFLECWGGEMRSCKKTYTTPSNNRAMATCSGMMTPGIADIMGLVESGPTWIDDICNRFDFATLSFGEDGSEKKNLLPPVTPNNEHAYLHLAFPLPVLIAMKALGMSQTLHNNQQESDKGSTFVSTNDMLTAFGWLMKRELSGNSDWNMSMVVNLRGRCGVEAFGDSKGNSLFGNGIVNVVATLPICRTDEGDDDNQVSLSQISAAALVIRNALTQGLLGVTDSISCARKGQRPTSISTGSCFSTTSWSFPIWDIDFGATLVGFHGHPSYPIPDFNMFSSVIVPGSQHGDRVYQLLIPCVKVKEAEAMHQRLCTLFLEWHAMEAANFGSPL